MAGAGRGRGAAEGSAGVCPAPSLPGPGAHPRGCVCSSVPASLHSWCRQFRAGLELRRTAPGWVRGGQTTSWEGLGCPEGLKCSSAGVNEMGCSAFMSRVWIVS